MGSLKLKEHRKRGRIVNLHELLNDIHALEADLHRFEKKYGLRSETFYAAYSSGEEPENDTWVLELSEWASVYVTWLARLADYRTEIQCVQDGFPSLKALLRAAQIEEEERRRKLLAELKALRERPVTEEELEFWRKFDEDLARERLTFREPSFGEVTLRAHFDGEQIRLDTPFDLKPGTPLMVIVDSNSSVEAEREDWHRLSAAGLERAYDEDEPEYTEDMIKEPNPDYEQR